MLLLDHGAVDLDREQLLLDGQPPTPLTPLEAALLRFLAARAGQVVSRETLQAEVWGYAPEVMSRAVDNCVRRLRAKLEPDPQEPRHLLTVFNEGYRLRLRAPPPAPTRRPSMHGREDDKKRLTEALDGGARLLTLCGPGGVGKTRLSLSALDARGGAFVDCAEALDAEALAAATARALGSPGGDALLQALPHMRPKLVVLDNCEQALAGARAWAAQLLRANAELQLLVTSRAPLGLPEERVLLLQPLDLGASVEVLQARADALGAVPLPDEGLEALAARLEGLPLSLELAAARLGVLGPQELLERLDAALDLLGQRGAPGRHATLRATLAWSWDLLDAAGQRALAASSVFSGGFDAGAAEAVLGLDAGATLDALEQLRRSSLLQVRPAPGGRRRLHLLDVVRQLAAEQLGEAPALRRRHAQWCLALPPGRWGQEHANLRAAWAWAVDADPALAADLCEALSVGFRAHGPPRAWRQTLARTQGLDLDPARAAALALRSLDARRLTGDNPDEHEITEVRSAAVERADPELSALAELTYARWLRMRSRTPEAEEALARGLARSPSPRLQGLLLVDAGSLAADHQRHREAIQRYRGAIEALQSCGDDARVTRAELHLAMVLSEEGDLDAAQAAAERSLTRLQRAEDTGGEGVARSHLALVALEAEALERAEEQLRAAQRCHQAVGARRFEAYGMLLGAMLAQLRGQLPEGARHAGGALRVFREVGDQRFAALAQARRGALRAQLGEVVAAERDLRAAREALARFGNPSLTAGLDALDGLAELAKGDLESARARLTRLDPDAPSSFARMAWRLLAEAARRG